MYDPRVLKEMQSLATTNSKEGLIYQTFSKT